MDRTLWAQSIHVNWAPRLSFLERRARFAAQVEEGRFPVRAFRVDPDTLGIRLGDTWDELSVTSTGFSYDTAHRGFDERIAFRAIDLLISAIAPTGTTVERISYQYLAPIPEKGYEEARRLGVRSLLGRWTRGLDIVDYALLVDGHDPTVGDFKVEFGVVESSEVELRLSRAVGRSMERPRPLPPGWSDHGVPDVALFLDISWSSLSMKPEPESLADRILQVWRTTREASWELVGHLEQSYLSADRLGTRRRD